MLYCWHCRTSFLLQPVGTRDPALLGDFSISTSTWRCSSLTRRSLTVSGGFSECSGLRLWTFHDAFRTTLTGWPSKLWGGSSVFDDHKNGGRFMHCSWGKDCRLLWRSTHLIRWRFWCLYIFVFLWWTPKRLLGVQDGSELRDGACTHRNFFHKGDSMFRDYS